MNEGDLGKNQETKPLYSEALPEVELPSKLPEDRWLIFGLQGQLGKYTKRLNDPEPGKENKALNQARIAVLEEALLQGRVDQEALVERFSNKYPDSRLDIDTLRAALDSVRGMTKITEDTESDNPKVRRFKTLADTRLEDVDQDPERGTLRFPKTTEQLQRLRAETSLARQKYQEITTRFERKMPVTHNELIDSVRFAIEANIGEQVLLKGKFSMRDAGNWFLATFSDYLENRGLDAEGKKEIFIQAFLTVRDRTRT